MQVLGFDLKGIGSEGVVVISLYLLIRHLVIPMYRWLMARRGGQNDTFRRLNPNDLTLGKLHQALKFHELMDEKRCDEMRKDIKELNEKLAGHSARLAVLEAKKRS